MTSITSETTVAYGGVTLGGSSQYYLLDARPGKMTVRLGYETGSFEIYCVVWGSSHAELLTKASALEAAWRKPRQDLTVTINGETFIDWSHSSNTGMNARPTCEKFGDDADLGLSRCYRCAVEVDLPADLSGLSARREATVDVAYMPSRIRKVTISATFTASGANDARAQYEASVSALASSVQTALGITTWKLIDEPSTSETDGSTSSTWSGKLITITRAYLEIRYDRALITTAGIIDPQLTITRRHSGAARYTGGGEATVTPLAVVDVSFSCWVDIDQQSDLASLYDGTILPGLIEEVRDSFEGASTIALMSEEKSIDPVRHTIEASLTVHVRAGGNLIERSFSRRTRLSTGTVAYPVWTGDPFAKVVMGGVSSATTVETEFQVRIGKSAAQLAPQFSGSSGGAVGQQGFGTGFGVSSTPGIPGQFFNALRIGITENSSGGRPPQAGAAAGPASPLTPPKIPSKTYVVDVEHTYQPSTRGTDDYKFEVVEESLTVTRAHYTAPKVKVGTGGTESTTTEGRND